VFATFDDGQAWTNAEAWQQVRDTAGRLKHLGIAPGDRVAVWLPNGASMLRYIFAVSALGAVLVPVNIALVGSPLAHVLTKSAPRLLIAHAELLDRLAVVETSALPDIVTVDGNAVESVATGAGRVVPETALTSDTLAKPHLYQPWDLMGIVFSSGTTGPSKGVQIPHAQVWSLGRSFYGYTSVDDRMLLVLPLFHIGALGALYGAMSTGASLALTESCRASTAGDVVGGTGATTVPGLGRTLIETLMRTPARADDADNPLRVCIVQSGNALVRAFAQRFGCQVMACYSMTETSCIAISPLNGVIDGSLGRPRKGIEVRLVDEHDREVPEGSPGEVVVRASLPWVLNAGYFRDPEASQSAWRNGWFHTGDVARKDELGNLYFVDRNKDVIRRRSENISSSELEAEVRTHITVADAAAIGVETAEGEEVLVVVVPSEGQQINPSELIHYLIERLPHYMVPRFLRVVTQLPKTQGTNRVQKASLRVEGITPDCWDREAVGIKVKRRTLSTKG